MSLKNINSKLQSERGFTIVELLIVIVVIAILAAITIVAYNGITARANTTGAQAAARGLSQKVEAYNAEEGRYPISFAELSGASSSAESWYVPSGSYSLKTTPADFTVAPDPTNQVRFLKCAASGATQASITATNITGVRISYWKFDAPTGQQNFDAGTTTACPTAV